MATVSKVEEITAILRTEILRGQYRPGERLPSERDLSARFETNRGAIREVVKKLEQLGIIAVAPGGVRVLPLEEATLEVLGYLLELGEVQRPELIGQMLDVLGAMTSLSIRSALAKATDNHNGETAASAVIRHFQTMKRELLALTAVQTPSQPELSQNRSADYA
jgi:DNA-binding FadR family transcriptional regulator